MAHNYTQEEVIDAIKGSNGIITLVASRLGCSYHTAERYIHKTQGAEQALEDETDKVLDLAENKLYESIKNGERWAVKFFLMMKGQKRGYMTTNYIKQDTSSPLNINLSGSGDMTRAELGDADNVEIGGLDEAETETD